MPPRQRAPLDAPGHATPTEGAAGLERMLGRIEGLLDSLRAKIDEQERRGDTRHEELTAQVRDLTTGLARQHAELEGRVRLLEARSEHIVPRTEHQARDAAVDAKLNMIVAQQQGVRLWLRDAGALGGLLALLGSAAVWLARLPAQH